MADVTVGLVSHLVLHQPKCQEHDTFISLPYHALMSITVDEIIPGESGGSKSSGS